MICNFNLSVAARKLVFADPSLRYTIACCWDVKQATNIVTQHPDGPVVRRPPTEQQTQDRTPLGRNSSVGGVLGSLSCLKRRRGFHHPLRRIFLGRGDFSLGVNMGSGSIRPKLFRMRV